MKTGMKMTVTASLAAATLALAGLSLAGADQPMSQRGMEHAQQRETARSPEVMVVVFHADWCPNCKTLGPKMVNSVFPEIKSEPYLLVKLDFTDSESNQAEYMLSSLGLGKVWEQYGRKTGFALVIDAKTKEVLHTIKATDDPETAVAEIQDAIRG